MKFHYGPVLLVAALMAPLGCAEGNQPQAPQQPAPGTQDQPATPDAGQPPAGQQPAGQPPAGQPPAGQQSNQPYSNPGASGTPRAANSNTEPPTFDANRSGSATGEESPTARPNSGLPAAEDSPATGFSFGEPNDEANTQPTPEPAPNVDLPSPASFRRHLRLGGRCLPVRRRSISFQRRRRSLSI